MGNQYINVCKYKNNILVREFINGIEQKRKVKYKPYLFQRTLEKTDFRDFYNNYYLEKRHFESIFDMKEYIKTMGDLKDELWGNSDAVTQFIYDEKYEEFDPTKLIVSYLDIEVCTRSKCADGTWVDGGFPNADEAIYPINAICDYRSNDKKYYVFTTAGGWSKEESQLKYAQDVVYIFCKNEQELITKFVKHWSKKYPHILTGWNVKTFDVPYIVNRIKNLFGDDAIKILSPWQIVVRKEIKNMFSKDIETYDMYGISTLDYLDLYKKYNYSPREKYTLDYISNIELKDEHKLRFEGTHGSLYYDDPKFFVDYNIQDVRCVVKFEEKLQYINIAETLCYYTSTNFEDNFSQMKVWDTYISKASEDRNFAIPINKSDSPKQSYEGAYVHEPKPGLKGAVCSFDFTSLYPNIMILFHIAPDVHLTGEKKMQVRNEIIKAVHMNKNCVDMAKEIDETGIFNNYYINNDIPDEVTKIVQKYKVSLTSNLEFYDVSRTSIFISLIEKLFKERKADKKTSFEYKHKAQDVYEKYKETNDPELFKQYNEYSHLASVFNTSQMVKKILLNSLYGAIGNNHFRYYNRDMARSITLMGQCMINKAALKKNQFIGMCLNESSDNIKDRRIYSDTDSIFFCGKIKVNNDEIMIGDFYNSSDGEEFETGNGKFIKELPENKYFSLSIDENDLTKVKNVAIKYVMKHKTSKRMYKVKVDGKEIEVTEDHSLMFIHDGVLTKGSVKDIKKGDSLISINDI